MMRLAIIVAIMLASPAIAADAPTVPLTQAEIQALVAAEVSGAIAQMKKGEAASIYAKLKAGFEPTKPVAAPAVESPHE